MRVKVAAIIAFAYVAIGPLTALPNNQAGYKILAG
jgi:hypothetical protein